MEKMRLQIHEAFQQYKRDNGGACHLGLERYLEVAVICLYDHNVKHDFAKRIRELSERLDELAFDDILDRATERDVDAILHLSLRYLGGSGIREHYQSTEGALWIIDSLIDLDCKLDCYAGDIASRAAIAQGHSIAAHAYHKKALIPLDELTALLSDEKTFARPMTMRVGPAQMPFTYFVFAVHHANQSARRGLVSHAVLEVGTKGRQMGESLGVDVELAAKEGKRFRPLWQAVSRYYEEISKGHRKVEDGQGVRICSADGCQVRGGKTLVLRACGGRCPARLKPAYCSRECQRKDWARHKAICKPHADKTIPPMTAEEKAKVANFFELGDREDSDETTSSSETEDESETESDEDEDEEDDDEDEEDDDEDEEDDDEDEEDDDEEDEEYDDEEEEEEVEVEEDEDDEERKLAEERRAEEERQAAEARRAAKKQRKAEKKAIRAKERAEARERLVAQKAKEAQERAEVRKRREIHKAMVAKRRAEARRTAARARREAFERRVLGLEATVPTSGKGDRAAEGNAIEPENPAPQQRDDAVQNVKENVRSRGQSSAREGSSLDADRGLKDAPVAKTGQPRNSATSGCRSEPPKPETLGGNAVEGDDSDTESDSTLSLADETDSYELTRWASMLDSVLVYRRFVRRHSNPF